MNKKNGIKTKDRISCTVLLCQLFDKEHLYKKENVRSYTTLLTYSEE